MRFHRHLSEDEIPFVGCKVFWTGIYRRDGSCASISSIALQYPSFGLEIADVNGGYCSGVNAIDTDFIYLDFAYARRKIIR